MMKKETMEVCDESRIHKRKSEGPVPTGRKWEGEMLYQ